MAGFDLETQRHAKMVGMCIDAGTFEFSSGSQTIEVPTDLARALMGIAAADLTATNDIQQTALGLKVGDVSNGTVTFLRAGGHIDEDARMSYLLVGW